MKLTWRSLIYIAILLVAVSFFSQFLFTSEEPTEIELDEAITMSQKNEINKLVIDEDTLFITSTAGTELKTNISNLNYVDLQELGLNLEGVDYGFKPSGFDWG